MKWRILTGVRNALAWAGAGIMGALDRVDKARDRAILEEINRDRDRAGRDGSRFNV